MLAESVETKPESERIPVFVTLMDGDPDGRWHRALEGLGATVGRFDAYLAAGTRVHVDCRDTGDSAACDDFGIESVTVVREDGLAIELADEVRHPAETSSRVSTRVGSSFPVGEVTVGTTRKARLVISHDAANPVLLKFTVGAWNANSASVTVRTADWPDDTPARTVPENDSFEAATSIEGENGSAAVDLFHATPEPGEPAFADRWGRPAGSVWYAWKAPIDGSGESPGTKVVLTVPAGASRTLHSGELESGAYGLTGALGDGAGKWQLIVDSDRPIMVINLLASPTGHLANLSTVPSRS